MRINNYKKKLTIDDNCSNSNLSESEEPDNADNLCLNNEIVGINEKKGKITQIHTNLLF